MIEMDCCIFDIVFHGTQTTVHVSFKDGREEKKSAEGDETIEGTLIQRKCPRCDHDEMAFTTRQLRSADGKDSFSLNFVRSCREIFFSRGTNSLLSMSEMLVCIFNNFID
jgi:hypothetical protein